MTCRPRTALRSLFQVLAAATLGLALAVPSGHAAERKKAPVKKQQTSASVTASKTAKATKATKATKAGKEAKAGNRVVARLDPRSKTVSVAKQRPDKAVRVAARSARAPVRTAYVAPAPRLSFGEIAGLHALSDPLDLKSSVALVIDQDTQEVLLSKNDHAVLPIASLTKLMTGLLISEARLPLDELVTITQDDVDTEKGSSSRLAVGTTLSRGELLHLALMSSENRAAHALGRTYPGGMATFVSVMNAKARMLGMRDTRYVEPTGLSPRNQSTAQDLALLVAAASQDSLVRQLSVSPEHQVDIGARTLQYSTTNRLVRSADWDIGVQKTGYISEAGQCLVMQAKVAGRKLIMVFLDATGRVSRIADAERVRRWVEATHLPTRGLPSFEAAHVAGD